MKAGAYFIAAILIGAAGLAFGLYAHLQPWNLALSGGAIGFSVGAWLATSLAKAVYGPCHATLTDDEVRRLVSYRALASGHYVTATRLDDGTVRIIEYPLEGKA